MQSNLMKRWRLHGLSILAFFAIAVAVQWATGVYGSEAGHFPDEAGHFVSGLIIRDYAVSGLERAPIPYAENYYLHFPKASFGIFPPLFHFLLGGWLLFSSGSFTGALAFSAMIMALIAWCLFRFTKRDYGVLAAGATGLLVIFLPLMRTLTGAVMIDNLIALFGLMVAYHTARYLQTEETREAVLLGIFGAAGCLVKGNGLGALLCPVLAIVLTGRYRVLRKPGLYIAAAIVICSAPIMWISLRLYDKNSSFLAPGFDFSSRAAAFYGRSLWDQTGGLLLVILLAGIAIKMWDWWNSGRQDTLWPSVLALVAGSFLFHILIPQPPDGRYIATVVAGLAAFTPVAASKLSRKVAIPVMLALAALALATGSHWDTPLGFKDVLSEIQKDKDFDHVRILVVSDSLGEGAMVGDVASVARVRPGDQLVIRGSKFLARSDWNANQYRLQHADAREVLQSLEDLSVDYIVLDRTRDLQWIPHVQQVVELTAMHPDRVVLEKAWAVSPRERSHSLELYRVKFTAETPRTKLHYFLDSTLGRELQN
ncbi:MAG: glycosyltransferase family 39 protein [Acidobacteriota bacterium]